MEFSLRKLFRTNRVFLLGYGILVLFTGYFVFFRDKSAVHLTINSFHKPLYDHFFSGITLLGSGWTVLILFIFLLFIKYRFVIILLISNFFITLVVQGMKHLLFPGTPRPHMWFKDISGLYWVPGIKIHDYNSFPSGHAATAFGLFFLLCLITRNNALKTLWFLLACLTAFSRVYLSQHFLGDILAGSVIGLIFTFFSFYYFNKFVPVGLNGSILKRDNH